MATYAELLTAAQDDVLRNRVRVAIVVAAEKVRVEADTVPNHALRVAWAKTAFAGFDGLAERMMWAVLAQNRALSVAAITGASDAAVQTAVDAAVDVFAV